MFLFRSRLLLSSVALMIISYGTYPKIVVIDPGPSNARQRANVAELRRQASVAARNWRMPSEPWFRRIH